MIVTDPTAIMVIRSLLCGAAIWLAVVVLRLAWRRLRRSPEHRRGRNAWEVSLSYAALLIIVAARQPGRRHTPVDLWAISTIVCIVLGYVGILRRNTVGRGRARAKGRHQVRS